MDGQMTNLPNKDDVLAILQAHRELGPEFDNHLADQILGLWRPQGQELPIVKRIAPNSYPEGRRFKQVTPVLALSIPLLAIAGSYAGHMGVIAVLGLDAVAIVVSGLRL